LNIEQIKSIKLNFILATARTGSTLLLSMLNLHPNIVSAEEEPFSYNLHPRFGKIKKWTSKTIDTYCNDFYFLSKGKLKTQFGTKQDLKSILETYKPYLTFDVVIKLTYLCFQPNKDKSHITAIFDKQLEYHACLEVIAKIYPDSKFIILQRDPRDQVLAMSLLAKRKKEFRKSFLLRALTWNYKYKTLLKKAAEIGKERFLEIKYEDLILNPEMELKRISGFFNMPYNSTMLAYDEHFKKLGNEKGVSESTINNFLTEQSSLLQKLNKNKIDAWKEGLTNKEANLIWAVCFDVAEKMGYKRDEHFVSQKFNFNNYVTYLVFLIRNIVAPKIYHLLPYYIKYVIVYSMKLGKIYKPNDKHAYPNSYHNN